MSSTLPRRKNLIRNFHICLENRERLIQNVALAEFSVWVVRHGQHRVCQILDRTRSRNILNFAGILQDSLRQIDTGGVIVPAFGARGRRSVFHACFRQVQKSPPTLAEESCRDGRAVELVGPLHRQHAISHVPVPLVQLGTEAAVAPAEPS